MLIESLKGKEGATTGKEGAGFSTKGKEEEKIVQLTVETETDRNKRDTQNTQKEIQFVSNNNNNSKREPHTTFFLC